MAVGGHSKWPEVVETQATTFSQTVVILRKMFASYGVPEQLFSDNGPHFASMEFAEVWKVNGIKHIRTAAYHPSSNGLAERFTQTFKLNMRKAERDRISIAQ